MQDVIQPLVSGAFAGICVDLSLFPVDTIKTRLQSKDGFFKAGGCRNLYAGVGSVMVGSTPGAAVFFTGYETTRKLLKSRFDVDSSAYRCTLINMSAASLGEILACLVRVPVEVVKQRAQVHNGSGSVTVFRDCLKNEGFMGLYRGYKSTVLREIPFSIIQFPLWEYFKTFFKQDSNGKIAAFQSGMCGFVAGGIAAASTTPLDVAKTRIMLAHRLDVTARGEIIPVLLDVWRKEGVGSLFAGIVPRVTIISVGGFIFLGVYDCANNFFSGLAR